MLHKYISNKAFEFFDEKLYLRIEFIPKNKRIFYSVLIVYTIKYFHSHELLHSVASAHRVGVFYQFVLALVHFCMLLCRAYFCV